MSRNVKYAHICDLSLNIPMFLVLNAYIRHMCILRIWHITDLLIFELFRAIFSLSLALKISFLHYKSRNQLLQFFYSAQYRDNFSIFLFSIDISKDPDSKKKFWKNCFARNWYNWSLPPKLIFSHKFRFFPITKPKLHIY